MYLIWALSTCWYWPDSRQVTLTRFFPAPSWEYFQGPSCRLESAHRDHWFWPWNQFWPLRCVAQRAAVSVNLPSQSASPSRAPHHTSHVSWHRPSRSWLLVHGCLKPTSKTLKRRKYTFIIGSKANSFVVEKPAWHFTCAVISNLGLEFDPRLISYYIRKYVALVPHRNQIYEAVRSKLFCCWLGRSI